MIFEKKNIIVNFWSRHFLVAFIFIFSLSLIYFLTWPRVEMHFSSLAERIPHLESFGFVKNSCQMLQRDSSSQLLTDGWEISVHSLCEEPIGEREAGDSRPLWPSSMECFLFRDWLLAGGGVGHLSRPLVGCELYGLPRQERWQLKAARSFNCDKKRDGSRDLVMTMSGNSMLTYQLTNQVKCAMSLLKSLASSAFKSLSSISTEFLSNLIQD